MVCHLKPTFSRYAIRSLTPECWVSITSAFPQLSTCSFFTITKPYKYRCMRTISQTSHHCINYMQNKNVHVYIPHKSLAFNYGLAQTKITITETLTGKLSMKILFHNILHSDSSSSSVHMMSCYNTPELTSVDWIC